ncbi:MAG: hypothetical protein M1822_000238 [Bathelium mastoideum]|nr:MAG: hypothetical protein M1822_000238 [Bathelium mastoideum]
MPADGQGRIYSATYSNVPVYEYSVGGNHVMRRRSDDWINATHILKVADFDKPQRTRILEREVQKGVHEKVQGGYGKYQGTWIPLHDGRLLAEKNHVLEKLRPIFDFVPGDRSPPPAPKHATAASSKPRAPRQSMPGRKAHAPSHVSEEVYDGHLNGDTPDNETIASGSIMDEDDIGQYTGSRKRKRGAEYPDVMSLQDQQHQLWADELLDYFMLHESEDSFRAPPEPPIHIDVNRQIDEKGHTALHWAAAMGDIGVVKDLIHRGARIQQPALNGDTPLMRAVMFTNNYDKGSMDKLFKLLQDTVGQTEWYGSTVFHHIAATTQSKSKYKCARYYLDTMLNKLADTWTQRDIEALLNMQDHAGDTAIHLCARYGATKCLRSLLGRHAAVDIPNHAGRTGDDEIRGLNDRRHSRRQLSSSPFQNFTDGIGNPSTGALNGKPTGLVIANGISTLSALPPPLNPTTNLAGNAALLPAAIAPTSPQLPTQPQYRCEAALTLSQQLPHLLLAKTERLAAQLDAEVAERDLELTDSDRLAQQRQDELEGIRAQIMGLEAALGSSGSRSHSNNNSTSNAGLVNGTGPVGGGDGQDGGGDGGAGDGNDEAEDPEDQRQRLELDALMHEAEALVEAEQRTELDRLLAPHGPDAARPAHPTLDDGDDASLLPPDATAILQSGADPAVLAEQLQLARLLAGTQQERRRLVAEVVQGLAAAGTGERQAEYRRLITGALGVREEDVEGMLPEILRELEEVVAERG